MNYEQLMERLSAFQAEEKEALQAHSEEKMHRCPMKEEQKETEIE